MENSIHIDPSECKVLGVFGNRVHLKGNLCTIKDEELIDETIVVITSKANFMKLWKLWLIGKQDYCERLDCYCGVGGYFEADKFYEAEAKITLRDWNEATEEYTATEVRVFVVTKFENEPNFEHG